MKKLHTVVDVDDDSDDVSGTILVLSELVSMYFTFRDVHGMLSASKASGSSACS